MINLKKIIPLFLILLVLSAVNAFGQRGGHGHHPHRGPGKKVVVVKRSPYRPNKVIAYTPYWGPKYHHHRRWVYFPGHNIYWDHWRNQWVFWNGTMWIMQTAKPAIIVNVNLESEKSRELKEEDDDVDDVYKNNDAHKNEPK